MPTAEQVREWRGADLVDRDGDKIGTIEEIYLDAAEQRAEWALVNTGLFGTKSHVRADPRRVARRRRLQRAGREGAVKDAPSIDPDGQLSQQEESELYRHYGLDYGDLRAGGVRHGRATRWRRAPHGAARRRRRTQRPDDRRRDDALRGGAARRHDASARPAACACEVRRDRGGHRDRSGAARGGARRARADHRRQPRRRPRRARHLRGRARGRAPRGGGRRREAGRAEGAHPPREGPVTDEQQVSETRAQGAASTSTTVRVATASSPQAGAALPPPPRPAHEHISSSFS